MSLNPYRFFYEKLFGKIFEVLFDERVHKYHEFEVNVLGFGYVQCH